MIPSEKQPGRIPDLTLSLTQRSNSVSCHRPDADTQPSDSISCQRSHSDKQRSNSVSCHRSDADTQHSDSISCQRSHSDKQRSNSVSCHRSDADTQHSDSISCQRLQSLLRTHRPSLLVDAPFSGGSRSSPPFPGRVLYHFLYPLLPFSHPCCCRCIPHRAP